MYGDWWNSYTALSIPAAILTGPIAFLVGPALDIMSARTTTAAPTPPVAPDDVRVQQAAQIEAAIERYNRDPAASAFDRSSWMWPVAIASVGALAATAIVSAQVARRRPRRR